MFGRIERPSQGRLSHSSRVEHVREAAVDVLTDFFLSNAFLLFAFCFYRLLRFGEHLSEGADLLVSAAVSPIRIADDGSDAFALRGADLLHVEAAFVRGALDDPILVLNPADAGQGFPCGDDALRVVGFRFVAATHSGGDDCSALQICGVLRLAE